MSFLCSHFLRCLLRRSSSIVSAVCLMGGIPVAAADYDITRYGAVANDVKPDTSGIQYAVDEAWRAGGGRVIVPTGKFITGRITLKDNVTIRLNVKDSLLEGSSDFHQYGAGDWTDALIVADGGKNKRVEGPGIIDGVECLNLNGEAGYRGPHAISFSNCDGFTVADITIRNAANYSLIGSGTTGLTKNITVRNVTIRAGEDGLHIQGGASITVSGCDFQSRDDAFAGCDNVDMSVTDCQINSSCNGMRLGVNGLTVKHCRFWGPGKFGIRGMDHNTTMDTAYCYFSPSDRNPTIPGDNVLLQDCSIENTGQVFEYEFGDGWQEGQVLKNVAIRRVIASGLYSERGGIWACGDAKRNFTLTLDQVDIGFCPGNERNACLVVKQFDTCTIKDATLRNSGEVAVAEFENGKLVIIGRLDSIKSQNGSPIVYTGIGSVGDIPVLGIGSEP